MSTPTRLLAALVLSLPAACCPDPPAPAPGSLPAPPGVDANSSSASNPGAGQDAHQGAGPSAAELLDSHASQLARLPTLVSGGVLELSWDDADGHHFEQGDLDLRHRAPNELSLRLSKVGETQFMGGCNADAWWWFEGWSKPTRFWTRPRAASRNPDDANRPPITMDEMLALLGLRELGRTGAEARRDPETPPWIVRFAVELSAEQSVLGLPTRVFFDRGQLRGESIWLPMRIEVLDADGVVLIASQLDEYRRIERRERAPGDWPAIATRVRVTVPARGERGAFAWLVVLDRPSASGERIVEKLFDPTAVRDSLRPQLIDDGSAPEPP